MSDTPIATGAIPGVPATSYGRPVRNFRFRLAILGADEVPAHWLRDRATAAGTELTDRWAPDAWSLAKKGRIVKRQARAEKIREKVRQVPG